jgi:hypothetical protein
MSLCLIRHTTLKTYGQWIATITFNHDLRSRHIQNKVEVFYKEVKKPEHPTDFLIFACN